MRCVVTGGLVMLSDCASRGSIVGAGKSAIYGFMNVDDTANANNVVRTRLRQAYFSESV